MVLDCILECEREFWLCVEGESDASTDRGLSISSESLWDWEAAGESMICDQQIFLCVALYTYYVRRRGGERWAEIRKNKRTLTSHSQKGGSET
jgi:hypothetical protein